ncbi:hypothetical protein BB560_001721 [Smittium megazygosporum]|uniref:Pentacotripeptide-repeat region of PRORP domain-containing protein n=1 Tax=Smittium megazygosporum TaxID=133381 RepID=A0A2T9ZGQ7_9FUNG|nr:hypothetical protein BB560_001721 [Smittium megazygosporum]
MRQLYKHKANCAFLRLLSTLESTNTAFENAPIFLVKGSQRTKRQTHLLRKIIHSSAYSTLAPRFGSYDNYSSLPHSSIFINSKKNSKSRLSKFIQKNAKVFTENDHSSEKTKFLPVTHEGQLEDNWELLGVESGSINSHIYSVKGYISILTLIRLFGVKKIWSKRTMLLVESFRNNYGYYIQTSDNKEDERYSINRIFLTRALGIFAKYGDVSSAENVFNELKNGCMQNSYKPLKKLYGLMVIVYANSGDIVNALKVTENFEKMDLKIPLAALVSLVQIFSRTRKYDQAEQYLNELLNVYDNLGNGGEYIPSRKEISKMRSYLIKSISFFAKSYGNDSNITIDQINSKYEYYKQYPELIQDISVYNAFLESCLLRNLKNEANNWMSIIRKNRIKPNPTTFNIWINYFIKNNSWTELDDLLCGYGEGDFPVNPSTDLLIIRMAHKKNDMLTLKRLFWDCIPSLISNGTIPGKDNYLSNTVSFFLAKIRNNIGYWQDELAYILSNINSSKIQLNHVLDENLSRYLESNLILEEKPLTSELASNFNTCLNQLLSSSLPKPENSVSALKKEPEDSKLDKNQTANYQNNVYKNFCTLSLETQQQFWQKFKSSYIEKVARHFFVSNGDISASTLIYFNSIKNFELSLVLFECLSNDPTIDISHIPQLYYSVLYSQINSDEYFAAIKTLEVVMRHHVFKYGFPLALLSKKHAESLKGSSILSELIDDSYSSQMFFDLRLFTSIMKQATVSGDFDRVNVIWSLIKRSEIVPDTAAYYARILAYKKSNDIESQILTYKEMIQNNIIPNEKIILIISGAYYTSGDKTMCLQIIHDAVFKYNIRPGATTCHTLIYSVFPHFKSPLVFSLAFRQLALMVRVRITTNKDIINRKPLLEKLEFILKKLYSKPQLQHFENLDFLHGKSVVENKIPVTEPWNFFNDSNFLAYVPSTDKIKYHIDRANKKASLVLNKQSPIVPSQDVVEIESDFNVINEQLMAPANSSNNQSQNVAQLLHSVVARLEENQREIERVAEKNMFFASKNSVNLTHDHSTASSKESIHALENILSIRKKLGEKTSIANYYPHELPVTPGPANFRTFTILTNLALSIGDHSLVINIFELFSDLLPYLNDESNSSFQILSNAFFSYYSLNNTANASKIWAHMVESGYIQNDNSLDLESNQLNFIHSQYSNQAL